MIRKCWPEWLLLVIATFIAGWILEAIRGEPTSIVILAAVIIGGICGDILVMGVRGK